MPKPNDFSAGHESQRGTRWTATVIALIAASGLLLHLPLAATAGIATGPYDGSVSQLPPPPAAPSQRAAGTYQLRCWQYGRLLFDEGPVTLSTEARQGAKLVAIDRQGAPLIVTHAGGTTCLARPFAAAPNPALPR